MNVRFNVGNWVVSGLVLLTMSLVTHDPSETSAVDSEIGTLWNIRPASGAISLRLDVGRPDYLGPLLGLVGDEHSEIGGRAGKRRAAQIGKPHAQLGISESGVDLQVELINDVSGCTLRRADAIPGARVIARHEFGHGRNAGQRLRARCGGQR